MFKKGQKVVCINDDFNKSDIEAHNDKFPNWIVKDTIYTVRACTNTERGWGVLVEELTNPPRYIDGYFGKAEGRFNGLRFSPLLTDEAFVEEVIEQIIEKEEPVEA